MCLCSFCQRIILKAVFMVTVKLFTYDGLYLYRSFGTGYIRLGPTGTNIVKECHGREVTYHEYLQIKKTI